MARRVFMNQPSERRADERCCCNDSLSFQFSNLKDSFSAHIINCSPGGLSFSTALSLKTGTILFVRRNGCTADCDQKERCPNSRSMAYATIKWCQSSEVGKDIYYRVGAQYFDSGAAY